MSTRRALSEDSEIRTVACTIMGELCKKRSACARGEAEVSVVARSARGSHVQSGGEKVRWRTTEVDPKSQNDMVGCSHIWAHMLQQEAARVPPERDGSYLAGRSENRCETEEQFTRYR